MSLFLRIQAVGDLYKRYAAAFKHAWQQRTEMESPPRLAHEAQFLPAALALQDTPVAAAPRVTL